MTHIRSFCLPALVGLLALPANAAWTPQDYRAGSSGLRPVQVPVAVGGRSLPVELWSGGEAAAVQAPVIALSERYLPELESLFGRPYPHAAVTIVVDAALPFEQWATGPTLYVHPAALPVALAHAYVYGWVGAQQVSGQWLQLGLARAIAIELARRNEQSEAARRSYDRAVATLREIAGSRDAPLGGRMVRAAHAEVFRDVQAKAALFVLLVRGTLGDEAFARWVQSLAAATQPLLDEQVLANYSDVAGQSGESLFAGWVNPGAYQVYNPGQFADQDLDGLPDIAERLLRSNDKFADSDNDGLSDGYEYWRNMKVMSGSSDEGQNDLRAAGIAVDGLAQDWQQRSIAVLYQDRLGEGTAADLSQVSFAVDGARVCAMVQYDSPPEQDTTTFIRIRATDGSATLVLAYGSRESRGWLTRMRPGGVAESVWLPLQDARLRDVLEMCVPRAEFSSTSLEVNVSVRDDAKQKTSDSMGGWWQPLRLEQVTIR